MSIKSKVLAAAATLTLAGAAAMGAALPANAETAECGQFCVELFPSSNPQLILDDQGASETTGAPITTSSPSVVNEGEDFTISGLEPLSTYWQAGDVSGAVALHYGCEAGVDFATCFPPEVDDLAFELEFAPLGAPTAECVGVPSTAVEGLEVSLEPCGVGPNTIWIVDSSESIDSSYVPLITATDTNFSRPFLLTFTSGGASLETTNLQENSAQQVSSDQLWSEHTGPLGGPVITGLQPDHGPSFGFTPVVITGTGLSCPAVAAGEEPCHVTVTFGGKRALIVLARADEIVVLDPSGLGKVTVTVTVAGVSSPASAVTTFTYERFL